MPDKAAGRRRAPQQARALARRQLILDTAAAMIAETGCDPVKMSEIAVRAGVPIGSVYQFFPDKADIVRTLVVTQMGEVSRSLQAGFAAIGSADEALARVGVLIEAYYALFLQQPVLRDIWAGTQGDKQLMDLDVADSRANGAALCAVLAPFIPPPLRARMETLCFLAMHLTGAAVRLAVTVGAAEGRALMDVYKAMMSDQMRAFLAEAGVLAASAEPAR